MQDYQPNLFGGGDGPVPSLIETNPYLQLLSDKLRNMSFLVI